MSFSRATQQNPICIIDFKDPNVNGIDALRKLLSTVKPDCKLVCISIAGRRREGKSSLLCFCIRYLEARCRTESRTNVWMEHARDEELGGFPAKHGIASVTRGILIWPKLFKIEENLAVLLMDTQGIFDDTSTLQHDAKLISLSLLLSSVTIFNIRGDLDRDKIENLDIFTRVAGWKSSNQSAHPQNSSRPFQELIILIRDWTNRYEFDFGWTGGQNRFNTFRDGASKSKCDEIAACFEDEIQCFLMPSPGDKTVEDGSKKIADMRPVFRAKVKEFVEEIFRPPNLKRVKFNGEEITCEAFAEITERCIHKVKSEEFPTVPDVVSSVASDQINKLVEILEEEHRNAISRLAGKGPYRPASLETHLENELEKRLEKFDSSRKIGVAEITERGRQTLAAAIRRQNETFKTTNAAAFGARVKAGAAVVGVIGGIGGGVAGAVKGGLVGALLLAGVPGCVAGAALGAVGGAASGASGGAALGAGLAYLMPSAKIPHEDQTKSKDDSKLPLLKGEPTPPGIVAGAAAGASVGAGIGTAVGHSLPLAKISHRNSSNSDDDSKLPLLEQEGTEMEALIKRDNAQSLR